MRAFYAFLTMKRQPVTRLDVAWAFAWPMLTSGAILAAIIWSLS